MPTIHLFEVSVAENSIPEFIKALEDVKCVARDTGFVRVTDLDAFFSGKQTGIDDDFRR